MEKRSLEEKAIKIGNAKYVQVADRVMFFNENYPNGSIDTKVELIGEVYISRTEVYPDVSVPDQFYTGISQVNLNEDFAFRKAETASVGRALGFMAIGVLDSIASADEIREVRTDNPATDKQVSYLGTLILNTEQGAKLGVDKFLELKGIDPEAITFDEASNLIKELK